MGQFLLPLPIAGFSGLELRRLEDEQVATGACRGGSNAIVVEGGVESRQPFVSWAGGRAYPYGEAFVDVVRWVSANGTYDQIIAISRNRVWRYDEGTDRFVPEYRPADYGEITIQTTADSAVIDILSGYITPPASLLQIPNEAGYFTVRSTTDPFPPAQATLDRPVTLTQGPIVVPRYLSLAGDTAGKLVTPVGTFSAAMTQFLDGLYFCAPYSDGGGEAFRWNGVSLQPLLAANAALIAEYRNHLVLGHGVTFLGPDEIKWAAPGSSDFNAVGSGTLVIGSQGSPMGLTGLMKIGPYLAAYKWDEIFLVEYIGPPVYMAQERAEAGVGLIAPRSLRPLGEDRHIGLSRAGIFVFDGRSATIVSYPIDAVLEAAIDRANILDINAITHPERDEYWLWVPQLGGTAKIVVFNYVTQEFSPFQQTAEELDIRGSATTLDLSNNVIVPVSDDNGRLRLAFGDGYRDHDVTAEQDIATEWIGKTFWAPDFRSGTVAYVQVVLSELVGQATTVTVAASIDGGSEVTLATFSLPAGATRLTLESDTITKPRYQRIQPLVRCTQGRIRLHRLMFRIRPLGSAR